ncbi:MULTISPECIES: HalOD1 output domain-containing protein [Haladaptatus]|nr:MULTISPECIES: HalOD1 output domain-containing protein [Haladaptatus]SHK78645.1 hypothetical protein SAMN05444342_2176 [Haladaptatus paucihalophilus DX253]
MSERGTTATIPVKNGRVSEAVIRAVADAAEVDPADMTPLYDIIDPDALDRLFRPTSSVTREVESSINFTMAGCEVVVSDNRTVSATLLSQVEA